MAIMMAMTVAFCTLARPAWAETPSAPPKAQGGVLDLSGWTFSPDDSRGIPLAGEWQVLSMTADTPHQPTTLTLPQAGHGGDGHHAHQSPPPSRMRLGLTIIAPAGQPGALAVAIPHVAGAYRLWADGDEILSSGQLSDDRAGERLSRAWLATRLPVHPGNSIRLELEVSNHHFAHGGVDRSPVLGSADALSVRAFRHQAIPIAVFGALLVTAFVLLAFWVTSRFLSSNSDLVCLALALFTLLICTHMYATGPLHILVNCGTWPDSWTLAVGFTAMVIFPGLYLGFLRALFPAEIPRLATWPVYGLSAVMVGLVMISPPTVFTLYHPHYVVYATTVLLVGTALLGRALIHRRPGAAWLTMGSALFTATGIHDMMNSWRVTTDLELGTLGYLIFVLAYCAALAARLFASEQEATSRLGAMNRALEDKVAERTQSLSAAREEAVHAARAKSDFLAVMNHELRTPLHGWGGLVDLLEHSGLSPRQRGYVGLLRNTAQHLTRLIDGLLDMARLQSGQLEPHPRVFRLDDLSDQLAALGRGLTEDRGLDFHIQAAGDLPPVVRGDDAALCQIVYNFLDNAAKFTEHGTVRLDILPNRDGMIRFAVSDTGPGIPLERQNSIFDSFGRGDPAAAPHQSGAGLGLGLCRRLAEILDGHVGLRSFPGKGTTIWCDVPLPPAADDENHQGGNPAAFAILPPGTRILLADDVALNRMVLADFLAPCQVVLEEAADGAEALEKMADAAFDLVILDLRMPVMDGFEAAQAIREREQALGLPAIPMMALSACAGPADRDQARRAGFTTFLAKPVDRPTLIAALAALLSGQDSPKPAAPDQTILGPTIPEGLEHMLPQFIEEMDKDIAVLTRMTGTIETDGASVGPLAAESLAALAEQAHATRGKCGMFGETILFGLLTRLEDQAKAGAADGLMLTGVMKEVIERGRQLRQLGEENATGTA